MFDADSKRQAILDFKLTSNCTGYLLFKRAFNADNTISTPDDDDVVQSDKEVDWDEDSSPKARHEAMVNIASKANKAWANLSDERKSWWNEQALESKAKSAAHNPEDCFQYVAQFLISS